MKAACCGRREEAVFPGSGANKLIIITLLCFFAAPLAGCQDRTSCTVSGEGITVPCQVLQGDTATGPATALDMRTPEAQAIAREVGPLVLRTLVRQNHWRIQGDSWGTVTADRRARAGQLVELQGVRLRIVVPTHLSALAQQQGTTARCWTSLQAASLRARPLLDKYWPAWQAGPSFLAATYERSAGTWTSPDWPSDTLGPDVEPVRPPTAAEWPTP